MPKAEFGTPKWLSNKMKEKGLQKLKWYCQMCEKQCRDENGFKCHRMSEAHQRQMHIFMQRPGRYLNDFSRQFEATFMRLMRTRYCRTRVLANTVYCDLIADKQHIHMNATRWSTLSEFVLYLKRSGKCTVEHTDQGWYLEYIDKEKIEKEKRENQKKKEEITGEQQREKIIKNQIEKAWQNVKSNNVKEVQPFVRQSEDDIVKPNLNSSMKLVATENPLKLPSNQMVDLASCSKSEIVDSAMQTLDEIILENEEAKKKKYRRNQKRDTEFKDSTISDKDKIQKSSEFSMSLDSNNDSWIMMSLVVRVITEQLDKGKYWKKKGVIKGIISNYVAKVEMLESKDIILIDQAMLEPVIPGVNGRIAVIKGSSVGQFGSIVSIDLKNQTANVCLENRKEEVTLPFSFICRVSNPLVES